VSERWAISYRPKQFKEVLGQSHVCHFFEVVLGRYYEKKVPLPVGVLFGGHSGVGKTTLARIIAASLNCPSRKGVEPCGKCDSCVRTIEGRGEATEVDASFFGSVENMRALRSRLSSYSFSFYQVVIIDEAHMLSREAASIFLKLLEEPPENVFFVLVTTEMDKILGTVKSRLLEFRFRAIQSSLVFEYLTEILKKEKVTITEGLLPKLYQLSRHNLRDVIVTLEQLAILGDKAITEEIVAKVCGSIHRYERVLEALLKADYVKVLEMYEEAALIQPDFRLFISELLVYLGDIFKGALKSGDEVSVLYAAFFKRIYKFLSIKANLESSASAKLLFSDLIEVVKQVKGISSVESDVEDEVVDSDAVMELLTKED